MSHATGRNEMTIDDACSLIMTLRKSRSGKEGCLVFVHADSNQSLSTLALQLSRQMGADGVIPRIYVVQGGSMGEFSWEFAKIRKGARIRLFESGQTVTESGGLIFPQDHPIILIVEDFHLFAKIDQLAYCHLVDGEGNSLNLALSPGSVMLAGLVGAGEGDVEASCL